MMQKKNEQSGVWYFYSAYDLIITNASATKIENPNPNNYIERSRRFGDSRDRVTHYGRTRKNSLLGRCLMILSLYLW
jgi:hypothetical protein